MKELSKAEFNEHSSNLIDLLREYASDNKLNPREVLTMVMSQAITGLLLLSFNDKAEVSSLIADMIDVVSDTLGGPGELAKRMMREMAKMKD